MNRKKNGLGVQVALGVFGFLLAFGLSLAGGNTVVTSIIRGAIGLFAFFFLGFVLQFALKMFVGGPKETGPELRGQHIDLLLPNLPPEGAQPNEASQEDNDGASSSEFTPLAKVVKREAPKDDALDAFQDLDPKKLAEALRHLDE